jgi:hypothetical protein
MNAFDAIGITIMFVVCASLLLWAIIGCRGHWWIKAPVTVLTLYFGLAVWYSVGSYVGWPSSYDPPRKFILNWVIVEEPRKGTDDSGVIYLLVTKLPHPDDKKQIDPFWKKCFKTLGYAGSKKSPRLHKVPYSRPLHKQMSKAKGMIKKGQMVIGEFDPNAKSKFSGDGDGKGKGNGDGKKGRPGKEGDGDGKGYMGDNEGLGDFKFYQLPPPKFPDKD